MGRREQQKTNKQKKSESLGEETETLIRISKRTAFYLQSGSFNLQK